MCSYIYAAESRLLTLIREFDDKRYYEKLVSKYRTAKRVQDASVANEQYRDRELSHYYDHDGCLIIKARLPVEQGALIVKALEMAMDKDFAAKEIVGAASCGSGVLWERRLAAISGRDGPPTR